MWRWWDEGLRRPGRFLLEIFDEIGMLGESCYEGSWSLVLP